MNPMQLLMSQLQNQLKAKNPQAFQQFQNLRKNQSNPQDLLNNMMKNYSPEQRQKFIKFANGFGVNEEQLNKYGISNK